MENRKDVNLSFYDTACKHYLSMCDTTLTFSFNLCHLNNNYASMFIIFFILNRSNCCFLDHADECDLQDLMTELTILKEVNKEPHPNVIRLIGGCSIDGI